MSHKLIDSEIGDLTRFANAETNLTSRYLRVSVACLLAEVLEHRARLATPLPCGYDEPVIVTDSVGRCVQWEQLLPAPIVGDEAIALGAGLVRAGLKANKP